MTGRQPSSPLASPMLVALLGLLLVVLAWYLPGRPTSTHFELPRGKLASLSYAPYLRGDSPLSETHADAATIERDLALIAPLTRGVRTYSSGGGFDLVPGIAARLGLEVMHGAWVNGNDIDTSKQVSDLIRQAKEHPASVRRVIVGNEVLLRKDLPPERLIDWIRTVKAAVPQPVTYADVWEYWLKHPGVAEAVDFITVHFLPYWENDPISAEEAVAHIGKVYQQMRARFPGKEIVIGEVGWPSAGRMRESASASRQDQAAFLSAFLRLAEAEGFDYNLIEAFDQPWKRVQEGRTGGNWGLYTAERQPKYEPGAPVSDKPRWLTGLTLTLALFAALAMLVRKESATLSGAASASALGFSLVTAQFMAMALYRFLADDIYNDTFWNAAPRFALQWLLALALWADTIDRLSGRKRPGLAPTISAYFGRLHQTSVLEHLYRVSVALMVVQTLLIALDGRYRDFPHDDFLVLAFGFLAARIALLFGQARTVLPLPGDQATRKGDIWFERHGCCLLLVAGLVLLVRETPANLEMLFWLLQLGLVALPHWHAVRRAS